MTPIGSSQGASRRAMAAATLGALFSASGASHGRARTRTLDAIPLRLIGPSAPSGRVWNVVGVPGQPKTFYACTAEGGVWRTTNNGTTMTPIFDEENAASCGAVAIAPSDPNIIWVGIGRAGGAATNGARLRRVQVGGRRQELEHLGLEKTEQIARIVDRPRRSADLVYVACAGPPVGTERRARRLQDDRRRQDVAQDALRRRQTGCIDVGDRSAQLECRSTRDVQRAGGGGACASRAAAAACTRSPTAARLEAADRGSRREPLSKITLAVAAKTRASSSSLSGEPQRGGRPARWAALALRRRGRPGAPSTAKLTSAHLLHGHQASIHRTNRIFSSILELCRSDDGGANWVPHNVRERSWRPPGLWIDPTNAISSSSAGTAACNGRSTTAPNWSKTVHAVRAVL